MLAVDNLNGIELCGRTICVDHVKQYKIPREYMYLSESEASSEEDGDDSEQEKKREAKAKDKWEKKLYKPTGPDGAGWGDFRRMSAPDKIILEELLKIEEKEAVRREKLTLMHEMKEVKLKAAAPEEALDENQRWELQLRKQQEKDNEEDR